MLFVLLSVIFMVNRDIIDLSIFRYIFTIIDTCVNGVDIVPSIEGFIYKSLRLDVPMIMEMY